MAEELQERYLYTVNPKRAIRNLTENIPILRTSRSLYLTKEEVLKCLESGTVYRRFSRYNKMEKITKYDIDRVHRDTYISKEDWNKMQEQSKKVENLNVNGNEEVKPESGTTNDVQCTFVEEKVAEPIKEELVEVSTEETIEGTVEELPTETSSCIEEAKEELVNELPDTISYPDDGTTLTVDFSENADSKEEVAFINEDTQEESDIDESEDDEVVEDENSPVVETEFKSNSSVVVNYNGGKKKKHKH